MTTNPPQPSDHDADGAGRPYPAGNPFEPPVDTTGAPSLDDAKDGDALNSDMLASDADGDTREDVPAYEGGTHDGAAHEGGSLDSWAETLDLPAVDFDAIVASMNAYGLDAGVTGTDDDAFEAADTRTDGEGRSRTPPPAAPFAPAAYTPGIALPPLHTLRRGSLGSLAPAALLIGGGAWLTFALATGAAVQPAALAAAALGGLALAWLAHALGRRLWSPGLLFAAFTTAGVLALGAAVAVPGGLDAARVYPLILGVVGAAMLLAALAGRPRTTRALWPGVLLIAGAGVGLASTLGALPAELTAPLAAFWPVVAALAALLLVLPLLTRRRKRA